MNITHEFISKIVANIHYSTQKDTFLSILQLPSNSTKFDTFSYIYESTNNYDFATELITIAYNKYMTTYVVNNIYKVIAKYF